MEFSCVVCMHEFSSGASSSSSSSSSRFPVVLPDCGHTICCVCAADPSLAVSRPCPICRVIRSSAKAPRNYAFEDAIAAIRSLKQQQQQEQNGPAVLSIAVANLATALESVKSRLARTEGVTQQLLAAGGAKALGFAEAQRLEAERRLAEQRRLAEEAEKQRLAEEAEKQRLAEEAEKQRLAEEAEKRRREEEERAAAAAAAAAAERESAAAAATYCHNCKQKSHQVYNCPWKRGGYKRPRH